MTEDMAVFKSYLRNQLRLLKELQEAIENKDFETAEKLIENLITDTQNGIED